MKLKQKPGDFRVTELLKDDYLTETGKHHVYKVTKRKLTSMEAAEILAGMANVKTSDVSMAGLKDRQGVTEQFMSFPGGKRVSLDTPELKIEAVGCAKESLSSANSYGNAFEVRLRDLTPVESRRLIAHKQVVARLGVPNYFDEQRFGNLKHSQGWVAKELMLGNHETALRNLLCAESQHDAGRMGAFKEALRNNWGDWSECRDIAGRFGEHHSLFDFLRKDPSNFAGAFFHVSSRLRLIHLYAFQSHIWNRAVAAYFAKLCGDGGARIAYTIEGPQVFPDGKLDVDISFEGAFRLPGEGLEDVKHDEQRRLLAEALADEGLVPAQFKISGVSGFQLKGEDRRLFIRPRHLKISESDMTGDGGDSSRLTFELPRGAYATLVVRGLLARFAKGAVDPKGFVVPQHNPDDERTSKDELGWKAKAAARGQRPGGWQGREGNSGGQRSGGWQSRDNNRGGGERSYSGGGRQGGWQGRDDNRGSGDRSYGGGGQQGGWQNRDGQRGGGQGQGGWQGRDSNRGGGERSYGGGGQQGGWQNRGGQRGGGQGQGGWQGRDSNRGGGERNYGGGGHRQGGWQGRDAQHGGGQSSGGWQGRDGNRSGGERSYGGGGRQGGWQGRDNNRDGGERSYGGGQRQGGWQGRDGQRGGGERGHGGGQRSGGWQGRDNNRAGGERNYGGGGGQQGGWQNRDSQRGGGERSYGGGQRSGGWQGRDNNRDSGERNYGGGRQGGWQNRDSQRGGGERSYGGGQRQGSWQGGDGQRRDHQRSDGRNSGSSNERKGGWTPNRSSGGRWSSAGQDSGRTSGGYNRERSQGGSPWDRKPDSRSGGGNSYGGGGRPGGWQNRDSQRGGGERSYGGGQRSGGWQGRDNNRDGGERSSGGGRQGGWPKRDDNREGGERPRSKVWEGANVEPPRLDTRPKQGSEPKAGDSDS